MSRDSPFDELEELLDRLQENFESAARVWDPADPDIGLLTAAATGMRVDLEETGDELVLTGDLPGFETADIDVRVADGTLRISAERDAETESASGDYLRRERRRTSVARSIDLPSPVDGTGVTATYDNGVLTVRMPKRESDSHGTRIDVN